MSTRNGSNNQSRVRVQRRATSFYSQQFQDGEQNKHFQLDPDMKIVYIYTYRYVRIGI